MEPIYNLHGQLLMGRASAQAMMVARARMMLKFMLNLWTASELCDESWDEGVRRASCGPYKNVSSLVIGACPLSCILT